jgi:cysteine desulfurase
MCPFSPKFAAQRTDFVAASVAEMIGYLDYAASAPMSAACRDAMLPWIGERFGNPSGSHSVARAARTAIEDARDTVAALLGGKAREIVFTGGGTEAINLAISGTADGNNPRTLISSAIEHDAVREAAAARVAFGETHLVAPVDVNGVVDYDQLIPMLTDDVRLVAVMAVNNEVGTIQPIPEIVELVRAHSALSLVLVDAVQGAVWLDHAHFAGAGLVVVSGHKFGGPQGVGALLVREGTPIAPIIHGGGQERERRSGTQNVAGIVGLAAALQHADDHRREMTQRITPMRDRLVDGLLAVIPGAVETSPRHTKVAGNAHICIPGVESESMLVLLDDGGICASAGSACASGAIHTSPVLQAMGVNQTLAEGALRLSLGSDSTDADVDRALQIVPSAAATLRGSR